MEPKILVLDIDGTLTNSQKKITEKTKKAIWDCMDRGHKVVLASGRPTPGMMMHAKTLELAERGGYLLSFNGGKIVECSSGKVICQKILDADLIPGIYDFCKKNGLGMCSYEKETIIAAFEPDEYIKLEGRINDLPIEVKENFVEYITFDVNKCLLTAPIDKAEEYEKQLVSMYGDKASIYRSEPFFIEIMPLNVDKAASLEQMLSILGMKKEQTICCGDGFNDISMIKYAGLGVAMANAQDAVKEVADYITASNDEDGIVQVIEKFMM